MKIIRTIVGELDTNCYFIINEENFALLIDPADEGERLIEVIEEHSLKPVAIILTHGHYDHIGAANLLADAFEIDIYAHKDDIKMLADPKLNFSEYTGNPISVTAEPLTQDMFVRARHFRNEQNFTAMLKVDELSKSNERFCEMPRPYFPLELLHLPGHTPGGIGLVGDDFLISGDTVFAGGGIGRTDLPGGAPQKLAESIEKVLQLPDSLILHAGHGGRSVLGREKPAWRQVAEMLRKGLI